MAIYKRYNGRRRRVNRGFVVWIFCILAVFLATAIFGYWLGRKARGVTVETVGIHTEDLGGESLPPMAEQKFHGIFVTPEGLAGFSDPDENACASVWLYREGEVQFATETDEKLGKDVRGLPAADFSANGGKVSGMFAVTYLYAEADVRPIVAAYEKALLAEFAAKAPAEIVLIFREVSSEYLEEIIALVESIPVRTVLCAPYSILRDGVAARFFTAAEDAGCPTALYAEGIHAGQLGEDVVEFGFYFTRYRPRLLLTDGQEKLAEILAGQSVDCWQFVSAAR